MMLVEDARLAQHMKNSGKLERGGGGIVLPWKAPAAPSPDAGGDGLFHTGIDKRTRRSIFRILSVHIQLFMREIAQGNVCIEDGHETGGCRYGGGISMGLIFNKW